MGRARAGRLIIFDRRGIGLSDRVGAAPTVEATEEDILTVIDAASSRRVVLIGASEGGPSCIRFAASHPERLAGLVLLGSMAKGSWARDYPFVLTCEQYDAGSEWKYSDVSELTVVDGETYAKHRGWIWTAPR